MASFQKPKLSLVERLKVTILLFFVTPAKIVINSLLLYRAARRRGADARFVVVVAACRVLFNTFTARQIQYFHPSTEQHYKKWMQKKTKETKDDALLSRLLVDIHSLGDGASSILWVGNRSKASKVVLYLHGGAYIAPAQLGHFEMVWNSYVLSGVEAGTEVAVAVLQYSLAPTSQFPTQLRQAASALSAILDEGFGPESIIIGGDSAGGNLTSQLLHHIVQPHSQVPPIKLEEPLAAAFMISPWIGTQSNTPSVHENTECDMFSETIIKRFINYSLKDGPFESSVVTESGWENPLGVSEEWLRKLSTATKALRVTIGEKEALADQGRQLVETLERLDTGVKVSLVAFATHPHDTLLLEGIRQEVGEATINEKEWFKQFLKN